MNKNIVSPSPQGFSADPVGSPVVIEPTIDHPSQFLPNWTIEPELLAVATREVIDDPSTRQTSLTTILQRQVSNQWKPRERRSGIAFLDESGAFFQLRYLEGAPNPGQRYDAVKDAGTQIYLPPVPDTYRIKINELWGLDAPLTGAFWDWVSAHPEAPLFFTEGSAKTLSLVGLGYPALNGFGAFGLIESKEHQVFRRRLGRRGTGRNAGILTEAVPVAPRLPRELAQLACDGRSVTLIPDMDTSVKTRRKVAARFLHTASLLAKRGARVRIAFWDPKLGKGIDDVLKQHGSDVVRDILDRALTPHEFELKIELSFELATPNAVIHSRSMDQDAPELPKRGTVFCDAAMATGKTKLAARETAGRSLLSLQHLRSLAKQGAKRLDATYREDGAVNSSGLFIEGDGTVSDRLSMCFNSLPRIDIGYQWHDGLNDVLLDEITHGLRHTFLGRTCKAERLQIIAGLIEAVRTADRVLAMDADLTRAELDILRELRPNSPEFYLRNTYQGQPWDVHYLSTGKLESLSKAIDALAPIAAETAQTGKLVHWASDSKKTALKVGRYLEEQGIRSVVVCSETMGDDLVKLAIAGNLEALHTLGIRVIVTSPSITQGISWEHVGLFGAVIGSFTGCSISPRQMRQSLARVREAVPRYLWCSDRPRNADRFRSTNPKEIRRQVETVVSETQLRLGFDPLEFSELHDLQLDIASRLLAADNLWRRDPRAGLKVLLEDAGHRINPIVAHGAGDFSDFSDQWEAERWQAIVDSEALLKLEYEALLAKSQGQTLTPSERLQIERYRLCDFYQLDPEILTIADIERDDDGRYQRLVQNFERLMMPDGADLARAATEASMGGALTDIDRAGLARELRIAIGLPRFIARLEAGEEFRADDPELIAWADRLWDCRGQVKSILNVSIVQDAPIRCLGDLLAQLGVKLRSRQIREGEKRLRIYSLDSESYQVLSEICERRYQRRFEMSFEAVTHPIGNSQVCDTSPPPQTDTSPPSEEAGSNPAHIEGDDGEIDCGWYHDDDETP